jgi:hypothetical protein
MLALTQIIESLSQVPGVDFPNSETLQTAVKLVRQY